MARHRYEVGEMFLLVRNGSQIHFKIDKLPPQRVVATALEFGVQETFERGDLARAYAAGELYFPVLGKLARRPNETAMFSTEAREPDFDVLEERYRGLARWRWQVIEPLIRLPKRRKADVQARVAEVREERLATLPPAVRSELEIIKAEAPDPKRVRLGISERSVWQWLRDYEEARDARVLVPGWTRSGAAGVARVDDEFTEIVQALLEESYLRRPPRSLPDITDMVIERILQRNKGRPAAQRIPLRKRASVYRQVLRAAKRLPEVEVIAAHHGAAAAQRYFAEHGGSVKVRRILERVELDHTRLDLMVVDEEDRLPIGRPWLTFAIDRKSGMPLGYYLGWEPPSYRTVMACLRHAILPKTDLRDRFPVLEHDWEADGLPELLVVDNGPDLAGYDLTDACAQLDMELLFCPPAVPWFKGAIERRFGILNKQLLHQLPGTTFSNIFARGDYDPAKHACISLQALEEMLLLFLVDIYPHRTNKSLRARPIDLWRRGIETDGHPTYPDSAESLTALMGAVTERTVTQHGIEFEHTYYRCDALAALHGLRVRVKYDPADLDHIWVFDPRPAERRLIEVPSVNPEYTSGLSLWQSRIIARFARMEEERDDLDALLRAKAKLRAIVDREWAKTRRTQTRQVLARYHAEEDGAPTPRATAIAALPAPRPALTAPPITPAAPDRSDTPAAPRVRRRRTPATPAVAPQAPVPPLAATPQVAVQSPAPPAAAQERPAEPEMPALPAGFEAHTTHFRATEGRTA